MFVRRILDNLPLKLKKILMVTHQGQRSCGLFLWIAYLVSKQATLINIRRKLLRLMSLINSLRGGLLCCWRICRIIFPRHWYSRNSLNSTRILIIKNLNLCSDECWIVTSVRKLYSKEQKTLWGVIRWILFGYTWEIR